MNRKNRSLAVIVVSLLILSTLSLGLAAEDTSSQICEKAFFTCFYDPLNQALAIFGPLFCGIGYAFCKKYIDPS